MQVILIREIDLLAFYL